MERIKEIDFLKCVFIILMVMFHLVLFADQYPYLKQIVYTFHMSGFLLISGFLSNPHKSFQTFSRVMVWIFIPYAIMEIGYVVMSSILPVRESVDTISLVVLLDKVFMHPIGPYWYLHTLIVCSFCYFLIYKIKGLNHISSLVILGTVFFLLSYSLKIVVFANAMYFLIGVIIRQSKISFLLLFKPSIWVIVPLVLLCVFPENLNRATIGGIAITYFVINLLLFIYPYLAEKVKQMTLYIGKNTLVILLFSPIFTMLSKLLIPLFSFDPTAICFMLAALSLSIGGSLGIAFMMDYLKISRFFFGKRKVLVN